MLASSAGARETPTLWTNPTIDCPVLSTLLSSHSVNAASAAKVRLKASCATPSPLAIKVDEFDHQLDGFDHQRMDSTLQASRGAPSAAKAHMEFPAASDKVARARNLLLLTYP